MARLGDSFWSRSQDEDSVVWPSSWTSGGSPGEEPTPQPAPAHFDAQETNGAAVEPELPAEPDPIAAGLIELQESISRLEALNAGAWSADVTVPDVPAEAEPVAQLRPVEALEVLDEPEAPEPFLVVEAPEPLAAVEAPEAPEPPQEPEYEPVAEAPLDIRETLRRLVDATDSLDLGAFAAPRDEVVEDVVVEPGALAETHPSGERLPQPADQSGSLIVRYDAGVELHFTGPSARFLERLLRASAELDSLARALPAELDEPVAADD